MNSFDIWIIHFVNSFARHSWIADAILVEAAGNGLLAGGVLMIMFWVAWGKHGKNSVENRQSLALTLAATTFAVVAARIVALNLPYRQRPLHNLLLHFQLPYTADPTALISWSSFPSDHAVLYFCVATGIAIVSRRLGALAISYATLMAFLRIYIGAHYPTDVVGGALLGIGFAFLSKVARFRKAAGRALDYLGRRPGYLYALLFGWTYEMGEMFDSLRHIGLLVLSIGRKYPTWQLELATATLFLVGLVCVAAWSFYHRHRAAV